MNNDIQVTRSPEIPNGFLKRPLFEAKFFTIVAKLEVLASTSPEVTINTSSTCGCIYCLFKSILNLREFENVF